MQPWFRLYREALHDPKLLALSDSDHRMWFNLLCLADPSSGKLPTIEAIGFTLRRDPDGVRTVVERLANGGLIDRASGGPDGWHYAIHGWSKRQFKSDTSTERVKRFRAVTRNVSETPSDTDTDTDSEEEKNTKHVPSQYCSPQAASETATKPKRQDELREAFDQFWPLYPRKVKRTMALEVWLREIRLEVVPDVVQAVIRFAELRMGEPEQYTEHASKWLRNGRWKDSLTDEKPKPPEGNGNGFKTRSQRNLENLDAIAERYGFGDEAAPDGVNHLEGDHLLGPGSPTPARIGRDGPGVGGSDRLQDDPYGAPQRRLPRGDS